MYYFLFWKNARLAGEAGKGGKMEKNLKLSTQFSNFPVFHLVIEIETFKSSNS